MLKWITGIVALCNPLRKAGPGGGGRRLCGQCRFDLTQERTRNITLLERNVELSLEMAKVQARNDAGERENSMLRGRCRAADALEMERMASRYGQLPPTRDIRTAAAIQRFLAGGLSGPQRALQGQFAQQRQFNGMTQHEYMRQFLGGPMSSAMMNIAQSTGLPLNRCPAP